MRRSVFVGLMAGVLAAALRLGQLPAARRDAERRLASYDPRTVRLSRGEIAYVDRGEGAPILSIHGMYGGYDQAFSMVGELAASHRIIAPSRFGYPGSDVVGAGTPREQGAAFVEMLDRLGLERVFVLAGSAGGTTAIRMALDAPDRVQGLILVSSASPWPARPERAPSRMGPPAALITDAAMWLLAPAFPLMMGMPARLIGTMLPTALRRRGIELDATVHNPDMAVHFGDYPIESLQPPVLLLNAKDDKLAKWPTVSASLHRYPRLTTRIFETGGHLIEGHEDEVRDAVEAFIRAHR